MKVKVKELDKNFPIPSKSFQELSEIENQLGIHQGRLIQMNESKVTLSKRLLELTELLNVLKETSGFFEEVNQGFNDYRMKQSWTIDFPFTEKILPYWLQRIMIVGIWKEAMVLGVTRA